MSELRQPTAAAGPQRPIVKGGAAGERFRYLKDALARAVVWVGGLGVIAALMLIFVYLLLQVLPLFQGAALQQRPVFALPGGSQQTLFLAAEEQGELGMRVDAAGVVTFFDLHDGHLISQLPLAVGGQRLLEVREISAEAGLLAAQLVDGAVLLFRHHYPSSYPQGRRLITPQLEYPYGTTVLPLATTPGQSWGAAASNGTVLLAAAGDDGQVGLRFYRQSAHSALELHAEQRLKPSLRPDRLLLAPSLRSLHVIDQTAGKIAFYQIDAEQQPTLLGNYVAAAAVRDASYLAGGLSIVLAQADDLVSQWFPARGESGKPYLARVRDFDLPRGSDATVIAAEQRRRGFAVGDSEGNVALFHATSGRLLEQRKVLDGPVQRMAFNSRAQYLAVLGADGQLAGFDVRNPHPEISLQALWGKVWYESYDEQRWLWQSSSASSDFEPKFSMTPLMVGTLKGAFYAMLFAIPIALLGAIFTATFMAPELRQVVKPTVEMLAALPSVVLGFLAGLWLAPFVETHLGGVFLLLLLLPLSVPLFGYLWLRLPQRARQQLPAGWEAMLLVPVIIAIVWLSFAAAAPMELMIFGGSLRDWMDRVLGIDYDQRNALVVGVAMGVAVIPSVFSMAEDAIHSVPRQLTVGSLALGATPWQTVLGVVLPTASPGIFSAIMIGTGRAVGETMIVLMATGNTPVTDFSLFEGMRTFAANIAVELPEAELGSTHFRLLFLAGLVLFLFTFALNTLAEVVRQRLRSRYCAI